MLGAKFGDKRPVTGPAKSAIYVYELYIIIAENSCIF